MTSTTFIDDQTVVEASWLNDVNAAVYTGIFPGSFIVPVVSGGTGATTVVGARSNLGLGSISTQDSSNVNITGGSISGITITFATPIDVPSGGTGSSTASGARTNLGVAIGSNVQAYSAQLDSAASVGNGMIAHTSSNTFAPRTLTGTTNRITIANGDGVSGNPTLDVGSNVYTVGGTDVAVTDGGTGSSTASGARTNLGLAISTDVQAYSAQLTSIAAIGDGIPVHTAANTFTSRTIAASAGMGISVSNGDGVAGNPTVALDIGSMTHVGPDNADFIPIYHVSGAVNRYATVAEVTSAGASGVTSLTGTANQITASAATGAVTVSVPYQFNLGSSSVGPSELRLFEDTDNGSNKVTIIAPASITTDATLTLQATTGTVYSSGGAANANLDALQGLTSAANKLPYFTGSGTAAVTDFTAAARTVVDDASVSAMVDTLGGASATGSGGLVRITGSSLVTPALGAATATSLNGLIVSTTTGTLTLANSSSLITSGGNSVTLTSTGTTNSTLPLGTDTLMGLGTVQTVTAAKTFNDTKLIMAGSSSGTTILSAAAAAGSTTQTFQSLTGTVLCTGGSDVVVADGGTGVSALVAYTPVCGGTTTTGAVQSVASIGSAGQVLTSNGAGQLPTFQAAAGGTNIGVSYLVANNFLI